MLPPPSRPAAPGATPPVRGGPASRARAGHRRPRRSGGLPHESSSSDAHGAVSSRGRVRPPSRGGLRDRFRGAAPVDWSALQPACLLEDAAVSAVSFPSLPGPPVSELVSSSSSSVPPSVAGVPAAPVYVGVSSATGFRPPPLPPLTPAERLRRRREVRQGKQPVDFLSAMSTCQSMNSQVRPAFFPALVPVPPALSCPTPSVRNVPTVSRLEATFKRRMRRAAVPFLLGRAPVRLQGPVFSAGDSVHVQVRVRGPPFSDEIIASLKAAEPTRSYYGGPEFACSHCRLAGHFFGMMNVANATS